MVISTNVGSGRSPWTGFEPSGGARGRDKRWHLTPKGELKPCRATVGACPYGGAPHVEAVTLELAQRAIVAQKELLDPQVPKNRFILGTGREPGAVGNARDLATFASRLEEVRGSSADRVEVDGTIKISNSEPIVIERNVNRLPHSPDKSAAHWRIRVRGRNHAVELTTLTEKQIADFVQAPGMLGSGVTFAAGTKAELEESREELKFQLVETVKTVEAEAALGRKSSVHWASMRTPERFKKDADDKLTGSLNYASTGFRPEHLRTMSGRGAADKLTVFESDAGAGGAAWKMEKKGAGWEVRVTGTRGDVKTFYATTSAEARAQMEDYFAKRVKPRSLKTRARQLDARLADLTSEAPRDATREDQRANRVEFVARMLEESAAMARKADQDGADRDHRKARDDHRDLYGQGDSKKGFGKIFNLLG